MNKKEVVPSNATTKRSLPKIINISSPYDIRVHRAGE